MTNEELKEKAVNIKGKMYVLVSDRIIAFNEQYKNGAIKTELLSTPDAEMVVVKATVTPDPTNPARIFTGHSQAKWGDGYINKTSALENCETSAVGRALAMMGIGVIDSVASVDEVKKAQAAFPNDEGPMAHTEPEKHNDEEDHICSEHEVLMKKGHSKSKNKDYWYHRNEDGQICFGAGFKE